MGDRFELDETHFDVLLAGTSLTHTILAAALAVAGKKVLHVDRNAHYGSSLTSLRLKPFLEWTEGLPLTDHESTPTVGEGVVSAWQEKLQAYAQQEGCDASLATRVKQAVFFPLMRDVELGATDGKGVEEGSQSQWESAVLTEDQDWTAQLVGQPGFFGGSVFKKIIPSAPPTEVEECEAPTRDSSSSSSTDGGGANISTRSVSEWDMEKLMKRSRAFWLDLNPHLILSQSDVIATLVRSNVYKYMQFRAIDEIAHVFDAKEGLQLMPLAKSGVFSSALLSRTEKWAFSRLVHAVMDNARTEEERKEFKSGIAAVAEQSFAAYLREQKLSERLVSVLVHCLCFDAHSGGEGGATELDTRTGVARLRFVLRSIGRYSPGPFILPLYGCSEVPQAFARCSAVYRTIHLLKFELETMALVPPQGGEDAWRALGVIAAKTRQLLTADQFVLDQDYVPQLLRGETRSDDESGKIVARCMAVVSRSVLPGGAGCGYADIPPNTQLSEDEGAKVHENPVHLIQVDASFDVCPRGLFVVYLHTVLPSSSSPSSEGGNSNTARTQLMPALRYLAREASGGPVEVLCASFYHQRVRDRSVRAGEPCSISGRKEKEEKEGEGQTSSFFFPENVFFSHDTGPFTPDTFDRSLVAAKAHFERLCPGQPFLPAPQEVAQQRQAEEESGLNIREIRQLQEMDADMDDIDGLLADLEAEELGEQP
jgi:RAB protein geranylgeranyltransferase component A